MTSTMETAANAAVLIACAVFVAVCIYKWILLRREHYARQRIQVVELQPIDIENAIREHEGGSRPPNLAQDPVSKVEVPGTSLGIHGDCILRIQLVKLRPGCKVAE